MKFKNIIWDWNGTLFDDIDACIKSMNAILVQNNLSEITSREKYKEIFCFPVEDYYVELGFNFDLVPFEDLAHEYISLYEKKIAKSQLFSNALEVLKKVKENSINQYIISASKQESLELQMSPFSINLYFKSINGLQNHLAKSKAEIAKNVINEIGNETVFIGDTIHDWEVAESVCCPCILISNGHQNRELLSTTSAIVVEDIEQVIEHIL